jgi:putative heme transporter
MLPDQSKELYSKNSKRQIVRIEIAPLTLVVLVLVAGAVWLTIKLLPVLLVLVAALMLVGALNPTVEWLETRGTHRGGSIAIVFGLLSLIAVLLLTLTIPALGTQVANLIDQEPHLRGRLIEFLVRYRVTASLADALRNIQYDALIKSSGAQVLAFSTRLLEIVAYSAGAFFLALYIMIDRDRLRGALFAVVPRPHHISLSRILLNLQTIVGGYIRGQVVTCVCMAVFMFLLLTACGVPNAVAFAVFGGIADVLPFIGIFLTMVPAVLAALTQGTVVAATVFILLLCYEEFESRLLIPIVYGRALRLPSSVVLFSLIAGGSLAGIVGALLALPVAAVILMLIDELRFELPGEEEQPEHVELKKEDERIEEEYERRTEGMPAEQAAAVAVEISGSRKKEERESQTKPVE